MTAQFWMSTDENRFVPFVERVRSNGDQRRDHTIRELERENAILRAKYAKALELLRRYKARAETADSSQGEHGTTPADPEPVADGKEKISNVWRERLLRMNSLSPRKESSRPKTSGHIHNREVLDLAEALNSGEFRLESDPGENVQEISDLLSSKRNVY